MTPAAISASSQCAALVSERIGAYERQMSGDSFPDLRAFVESLDDARKSLVLVELVKVDLERRWRSGRPRMLEDYFREYPELGDPAMPSPDLIQEEYKVRCRWGDAPPRESYYSRFHVERSELEKLLAEIDQSLRLSASTKQYKADDEDVKDPAAAAETSVITPQETTSFQPPPSLETGPADDLSRRVSPMIVEALRGAAQFQRVAAAPSEVPATIGRYRVEQELGSGGFGRVYRCHDEELKRTVAVKLPHGKNATSSVRAEEIIHEARSAARLRHPAIVMALDTIRCDDGRVAIVSEFVAGQSLRQHVRQKDYTRPEAIGWVADVADALAYAHKQQVVHRDVKPDNILIDAQRRPHLTDFGLAKLDGHYELDEKGQILGTLGYMSPEQASGQSHWASPAADIYSLGVMLYELLCGKLPFNSASQQDLLDQIRRRPPPPLRAVDDTISPALEAICLKALAKEPGDRFTSAADMARALRAQTRPGRNRWPLAVAAACLLAAVVGWLVFSALHRSRVDVTNSPKLENRNDSTATATQTDLVPRLDIRFQRAAEKVGHHRLEEVDLPLRTGDKVQLHATLAKPAYAYLYWCDGQGKPKRLWPTNPAHVEPVSEIWDPPKSGGKWQTWHVIGGPPAAELALMAVSDTPIPVAELERFEAGACQLPSADAARSSLLTVVFPETTSDDVPRNIDGNAVTLLDPLSADFEHALRERFRAYMGLIVTHD